ncbi:MAG: hypothetical protein IPP25_09030 [Saprospiraceae bacterium]|nr:hypothetical protein [Candidatus Opimibacter skivensis]
MASIHLLPGLSRWLAFAWVWLFARMLPDASSHVVNLFYKSAVFTILYGSAIWKFNISPDINHWIDLAISKGTSLLKKSK